MTAECTPCRFAALHGYWGPSIPKGFTHCSEFHVTFPASNRWGLCSRCGLVFSGSQSFDLHQRITKDGEIGDDCLCTVSLSWEPGESTQGQSSSRRWAVGVSVLVEKHAEWGSYWGQAAPEVFA